VKSENYFRPEKAAPMHSPGNNERVLVTGGSGFIGTNLVEFYRTVPGFEVLSVDIKAPRDSSHTSHFRCADITKRDDIARVVRDFEPTVVYHLAARTDLHGATVDEYPANTIGTKNVVGAVLGLATKPRRTVFASSRLVCKIGYMPRDEFDYCATTPYGASKVRSEQIVRSVAGEKFDWVMVRPTSIWGPWFEVPYRTFFDAIERGRYVHPKGRAIGKSFGFVGNTVYQLDRLAYGNSESVSRRTLYLCDNDPLDVLTWAVMIARSFNRREPYQVPYCALRALAIVGDAVEAVTRRDAPLTSFRLDNLLTEMVHDTSALRTVVGQLPFTVEEGVAITTRWIKAERMDKRSYIGDLQAGRDIVNFGIQRREEPRP